MKRSFNEAHFENFESTNSTQQLLSSPSTAPSSITMQHSSLQQAVAHIAPLNTLHAASPPVTPSIMTRKNPSKHPKPPKPPPTSLPLPSTPVSTVSAIPKLHSQANHPSHPQEKQVAKKSPADPRLSKPTAAKVDKAAEKAAELAALAAGRASLKNKIDQNIGLVTNKLTSIEKNIEKMEEDYIRTTWAHGNVLRGWDGLTKRADRPEKTPTGNGSGVATGAPKHRKSRPSDRIFSLSSSSSQFRLHNPDVTIQKRPPSNKKKKKR